MTSASLQRLVGQLRRTAESSRFDGCSDPDLLERIQVDRDPEAFEAIIRRHGACVLAACRKVLSSEADVEDAFQATFVILWRSARTIRQRQALSGWLSGVAHRVALKALASAVRRRRAEERRPQVSAEGPDLSWREACAILHEELDQLPDTYRLPLILCYLEGHSRDEAAQRLGLKLDALRGRLDRGRDRLRSRLTKRGVTLSAGLLAMVTNSVTAGGPPQPLLHATLQAATAARIPARINALIHGASPAMSLGKYKLFAIVLLTIGLIATSVNLSMLGARPQASATPEAPRAEKPVEAAKDVEKGSVEVHGLVLDPDGKPVAGAKLHLLGSKRSNVEAIATADAEGKFRFAAKLDEVGFDGRVVASGDGHAPDWVDLARCGSDAVTLRLHKDDVPFIGRVVTLEAQPVVGATLEVERLGKQADGEELKPWIDNNVKLRQESIWVNERGLSTVAPPAFGMRLTATTDKDGRFRLTGAGRDRVLSVRLRGNSVEYKYFWVVTRPDAPKDSYITTRDFNYSLNGPEVTVLVGPAKPIIGTIRDRATGKPVAGVFVEEVNHNVTRAFTDEKGQYRLEGVPKKKHYHLTAAGKQGVPYFDITQHGIEDTAGLVPLTADFMMDCGLELSGRIVDKNTGLPVAADVHYAATQDNPNRKDYPSLDSPRVIISKWGRVAPDGTFTILAIPGPGVVCVCATSQDRYSIRDAERELRQLKVRSFPVRPVHAILAVDPDQKKPASLICNVELTAGKSRKGTVIGPDDRPLEGVHVVGLVASEKPEAMKSPEFTLTGLSERKRILIFLHPEKKLGSVVVVRGDSDEPVTVKMQPLGIVEGRVLDGDGKPMAGLKVTLRPERTREEYDNLPHEWSTFQGISGGYRGLWSRFVGREVATDRNGRFRIEGALPGVDFVVYASDGDLAKDRTLVAMKNKVRLEAGKAIDLGVLKQGEGVRER